MDRRVDESATECAHWSAVHQAKRATAACEQMDEPNRLRLREGEGITARRGEMTCPDHLAGVDIPGRMDRPPAVKQATYNLAIYMILDK